MISRPLNLFVILVITIVVADASNFNKPHSHKGKVEPFKPGDPNVKLDGKAKGILKSGKPYQTQVMNGDSGRGLVVQDVDAPTDVVWGRILDYDNYANMVPKTVESKNYRIIEHRPTRANDYLEREIYTRMKVGFPMLKLEFFVRHFLYIHHHKSLTWTLDYARESDFDDSCGYWYCIPHPDDPDHRTRLYYSVQVSMFDWVPAFVVDFMSKKALTDATAWVKKYSEMEWARTRGDGTASSIRNASSGRSAMGGEGGGSPMGLALPFGRRKREKEEEVEEEERLMAAELAASEERDEMERRRRRSLLTIRSGWRRYVLVSVVLVLAIVNAAMFFGDNHEKNQ
ncbi:hypothetical protein ACHAXA_007665 [Cyclostephanos tholiformis]|uniref:Coenzyme Q-binding protein COQ10 START domain-containing protein n=1 Tax=Cyclostephanos tholiformis TaxID=382380 RepID=A0ABD3SDF5_9STRA